MSTIHVPSMKKMVETFKRVPAPKGADKVTPEEVNAVGDMVWEDDDE